MKCGRKSGVVAHEGGRKRGVLLYHQKNEFLGLNRHVMLQACRLFCPTVIHNDPNFTFGVDAKTCVNCGHNSIDTSCSVAIF